MEGSEFPFSGPEYDLWLLLSGTQMAISKARQQKIGRYIHHNQAAALVNIWAMQGKATPGSLSQSLFLRHHTVSELLTRLEKKGFITRHRDEQTRNVVRLTLTGKGMDFCREVTQADLITGIMSVLDRGEQQQLGTLLRKLSEAANREIETRD